MGQVLERKDGFTNSLLRKYPHLNIHGKTLARRAESIPDGLFRLSAPRAEHGNKAKNESLK